MKLFNIGMVLNWARKENDRRGCDSVFIKAAEDEYAALLKINKESAKLEASMEKDSTPNTTKHAKPLKCSDGCGATVSVPGKCLLCSVNN